MKYIKTYETLWSKNIIVGNIYKIEEILIMRDGIANISLGRIIEMDPPDGYHVKMKTYLKGSHKEFIFNDFAKKHIKRKAIPEEIIEFESLEMSKKYNIR